MALITIPTIRSPQAQLRLIRGDQAIELMGGAAVIMAPPKALWVYQFPLVTQKLAETRAWFVALVQLSKLSNTFKVKPPGWFPGAGYSGDNPTVNGGSQLGLTLNVSVPTALNTTIALAGDFVEVDVNGTGELKCLTQDATTDGTGACTLHFEPALRDSPLNGATVNVKTPQCTMRLVNSEAAWTVKVPDFYDISIDAIEHFGPQG